MELNYCKEMNGLHGTEKLVSRSSLFRAGLTEAEVKRIEGEEAAIIIHGNYRYWSEEK